MASIPTSSYVFDNIDDPHDWPHPNLAKIDALLRCPICHELFDTPTIIPLCAHHFCSLCIQQHLASQPTCPLCSVNILTSPPKPNKLLDEIVREFKAARSSLIDVLHSSSSFGSKEANTSESNDPTLRPTLSSKLLPTSSTPTEKSHNPSSPSSLPQSDLVSCPVCQRMMKPTKVDRHLDLCLNRDSPSAFSETSDQVIIIDDTTTKSHSESPKSSWGGGVTTRSRQRKATHRPKKLPKVVYDFLKENQLRKMVQDLGIPSSGDKTTLRKRHQHYLILHNVNCERSHPKSKAVLIRELEEWEELQSKTKIRGSSKSKPSHNQSPSLPTWTSGEAADNDSEKLTDSATSSNNQDLENRQHEEKYKTFFQSLIEASSRGVKRPCQSPLPKDETTEGFQEIHEKGDQKKKLEPNELLFDSENEFESLGN